MKKYLKPPPRCVSIQCLQTKNCNHLLPKKIQVWKDHAGGQEWWHSQTSGNMYENVWKYMATHDIIYGNHVQGGQGSVWTYDVKIYINLHSRFLKFWAIKTLFAIPTVDNFTTKIVQLYNSEAWNPKQNAATYQLKLHLSSLLGAFNVFYFATLILPPQKNVRKPPVVVRL